MGVPPLIGITSGTEPVLPGFYILRHDYVRSVELSGGVPVVLAPAGAALHPALLSKLDGLVLTGGIDVTPRLYREEAHPTVTETSAERDEFEVKLVLEVLAHDVPVLAICRGMQLLNVALGGTLVQDIRTEAGSAVRHDDFERPRTDLAHTVSVVTGTRLHELLGRDEVEVNTFHHQAVARLATPLVASAFAPDGLVEAVELPARRFVLGVQWHPEAWWREGRFAALFRALVEAAARRDLAPAPSLY
jgi:putative glutamine amidotransferase